MFKLEGATRFTRTTSHFLMVLVLIGCVQPRYRYGVGKNVTFDRPTAPLLSNPISESGEHPRIDRLESIVQTPHRFFEKHFKRKPKLGDKTPETLREESVELSKEYLADNAMDDVYIDIRRYEPGEQWSRLRRNDRIGPFWKYTGGAASVIGYTLIPQRAFHSDSYNPFTNTLSLNSGRPGSAVYQAAMAKEYHRHYRLGSYAMSLHLPLFPLGHHARVTSDLLTYANAHERWDLEKELYPSAYANLTNSAVTQVLYVVPVSPNIPTYAAPAAQAVLGGIGAATGHLKVRQNESARKDREFCNSNAEKEDN